MILFLIIMLSVVMVLDCIILCFLVLMQLPKKEAGAGLAFGGGATDALFGAGSGNFLTKTTKWTAGIFFALALVLSLLQSYRAHQPGSDFLQRVKEHAKAQPEMGPAPANTTPATPPSTTTVPSAPPPLTQPTEGTSNGLLTPQVESTAPAAATSNAPAQK
jgi:preprotein translocase subunit SecG